MSFRLRHNTADIISNLNVVKANASPQLLQTLSNYESDIDRIWEQETLKNPSLFNAEITCVQKIVMGTNDDCAIHTYVTNYKYFLAQMRGIDLGIVPLAVMGITFYREGGKRIFLLGKRSGNVTQSPNHYEFTPSGSMDANADNFTSQFLMEASEELGLYQDQIISSNIFTLIHNATHQVLNIGMAMEIENTNDLRVERNEYHHLHHIAEGDIQSFLNDNPYVITSDLLLNAFLEVYP